ncbi:MAG: acyl carrier protein [Lachnospiraceae bacterium]|nr:acyl carrier protein [Lachnospiraceae bacterium]
MDEQINNRLNGVFQEVFDDEDLFIDDDTNADSIDDWDSMEHINLVVAVEEEFGMKFSMDEIAEMQNVGDMVEIIKERSTNLD